MKKILIGVFMLMCLSSKSQYMISSWRDKTDNYKSFVVGFGSVEEYNFEHSVETADKLGYIAKFMYTRPYWINELAKWVIKNNICFCQSLRLETDRFNVMTTIPNCGSSKIPMTITAYANSTNYRTYKVIIIGSGSSLIKTFLYYWNISDIEITSLHKGVKMYRDDATDRITFDWTGNKPIITITANPMFTSKSFKIPQIGVDDKDFVEPKE